LLFKAMPLAAAVFKAGATAFIDKHLGPGANDAMSDAAVASLADGAAKIARHQPTFTEQFNETRKAIEAAGRNVLVMIDDIDRLHADELLVVMKAVRLLGRFDRVHYILSYDEHTVLDVLTGTDLANNNRDRAKLYLEKIVQYPIALPPIQLPYLENKLREQLSAIANAHKLPIRESAPDLNRAVDQIISATPEFDQLTLRSIYRWCNQVDILLTLVGPLELNFVDAALITFLRLWHDDVYQRLPRWRSDLLSGSRPGQGKLTNTEWAEKISGVVGQSADCTEVQGVIGLLAVLFPHTRNEGRRIFSWLRRRTRHTETQRVSEAEFFNRYFTLGFPVGDIRDQTIRDEMKTLVSDGSLKPGGEISASLAVLPTSDLVSGKALRAIDVVEGATSASAAKAAHVLTEAVRTTDLDSTRWPDVLYALLGYAVSNAGDKQAAADVMNDFVKEFGIVTAANILARKRSYPSIDDNLLRTASAGLRNQVLDACIEDLKTSRSDTDPEAPTILSVRRYLDQELWHSLQETTTKLLQEGTITLADLGARFVNFRRDAGAGTARLEFLPDGFDMLIPRKTWGNYPIPQKDDTDLDHADSSLDNRIACAAAALHQLVEEDRDG
jgi:hypothetical protein